MVKVAAARGVVKPRRNLKKNEVSYLEGRLKIFDSRLPYLVENAQYSHSDIFKHEPFTT
jgi:hypothetical protein